MTFLYYSEAAHEKFVEGKNHLIDLPVSRAYTYLDVNFSITSKFTSSVAFDATSMPSMLSLIKDISLEYNGKITLYSLSGPAAFETLNINSTTGCSVFRQSYVESSDAFTVKTFATLRIPFIWPIFRGSEIMKTVLKCPPESTLRLAIDTRKITDIYALTSGATLTSVDGVVTVNSMHVSNYDEFSPSYLPIIKSDLKKVTVQSTPQKLIYDFDSDGILCAIANSVYLTNDYNKSSNLNHNDNVGEVRLYSGSYNMLKSDIHTARSLYYGCYGPVVPRLSAYPFYFFYSLVNGSISDGWNLLNNNDVKLEKIYNKVTEISSLTSPEYIDENIQLKLLPF